MTEKKKMTTVQHKLKKWKLPNALRYYWSKLKAHYEETHQDEHVHDLGKNQYDDWLSAFKKDIHNQVYVRSRGGSKTFDFVNWLVLYTIRKGGKNLWSAPSSGNLEEAVNYFEANPFVLKVKQKVYNSYFKATLVDGSIIDVRIVGKGITGRRYKVIVWDEFQDLEELGKNGHKFHTKVLGTQTNQKYAKNIYLGTLWNGRLFADYHELYPCSITPWREIPYLVAAGDIQRKINEGIMPKWKIDLEYECILTSPSGLVFKPMMDIPQELLKLTPNQYGIDFGGLDTYVGINVDDQNIYILSEGQVCLDQHPEALIWMKGHKVCVDNGGYNVTKVGGMEHKVREMRSQLSAGKQILSKKFKGEIVFTINGFQIYCNRNLTPNVFKDIRKAIYNDDGIYTKTHGKGTLYENHYLDSFVLAVNAISQPKIKTYYEKPIESYSDNQDFGAI